VRRECNTRVYLRVKRECIPPGYTSGGRECIPPGYTSGYVTVYTTRVYLRVCNSVYTTRVYPGCVESVNPGIPQGGWRAVPAPLPFPFHCWQTVPPPVLFPFHCWRTVSSPAPFPVSLLANSLVSPAFIPGMSQKPATESRVAQEHSELSTPVSLLVNSLLSFTRFTVGHAPPRPGRLIPVNLNILDIPARTNVPGVIFSKVCNSRSWPPGKHPENKPGP